MADVLTYVRLGWTLTTSKINRLRNYVDVSHTDEIDGSQPDGLLMYSRTAACAGGAVYGQF